MPNLILFYPCNMAGIVQMLFVDDKRISEIPLVFDVVYIGVATLPGSTPDYVSRQRPTA